MLPSIYSGSILELEFPRFHNISKTKIFYSMICIVHEKNVHAMYMLSDTSYDNFPHTSIFITPYRIRYDYIGTDITC